MHLELPGGRRLDLSTPAVMAVLNSTPDSFSDGGRHRALDSALAAAHRMLDEGAAIIDIGGESTRPGSEPVSVAEECDRVLPLIERLCRERTCIVSIDTMKPEVMDAACRAGASIINDVYALQAPGAIAIAVAHRAVVCLMHMQGQPKTMQQAPVYESATVEVFSFLADRVAICRQHGLLPSSLMIDPGFGFGKTLAHNLELLSNLSQFQALGLPLLVGMSRKGMLGQITGRPIHDRLAAGVAAASIAVLNGASIVRTHDVAATIDAVKMATAVKQAAQAACAPS